MAPNENMIAYRSSAWPRTRANGAHMMKSAIGPDFGGGVHSDWTAMRDDETRPNFSVGMYVDKRH
jgi:hypothetical protein